MSIDSAGYVSIAELVVYIPALIAAIFVCTRHGRHRASGWIYTIALCVIRIAGAVCQLLSYSNHSSGLLKATLIIDSIGISPLLLASLGILSRYVDWINSRRPGVFGVQLFRLIQLLITVGLILGVAGGSKTSTGGDGQVTIPTTSKIGVILYIVAFIGITYILLISVGYRGFVPPQERFSPAAVGFAWPFILTRLAYSALSVFLHNNLFSTIGGNVAIHVAMGVAEEIIVVLDYIVLGLYLQRLQPEDQGEIAHRQWKARNEQRC